MAIATDIAIDGTGAIYYKGAVHGAAGAGYYTVIELHRFVQDLADDATAAGDDLIDITSTTPSDRSTDNIISILTGYLLDDTNGAATDLLQNTCMMVLLLKQTVLSMMVSWLLLAKVWICRLCKTVLN